MRYRLPWMLIVLSGCVSPQVAQNDDATRQVGSTPFHEPGKVAAMRAQYTPGSYESEFRVLQLKDKLLGDNPSVTLRIYTKVIGATDPEIFHVGMTSIYVTEGLVKQCNDAQLAAALANEMGKMISERERSIADSIRAPEPMLPISVVGGLADARDGNPTHYVEMAQFEKQHPKTAKKLVPPNPQQVARTILERAGFQSTDLDAVLPILQAAERNAALSNQIKGPAKQSDWKTP